MKATQKKKGTPLTNRNNLPVAGASWQVKALSHRAPTLCPYFLSFLGVGQFCPSFFLHWFSYFLLPLSSVLHYYYRTFCLRSELLSCHFHTIFLQTTTTPRAAQGKPPEQNTPGKERSTEELSNLCKRGELVVVVVVGESKHKDGHR